VAFLLFAALLGVSRADASLTKAADVVDLSRPALQLPAVASSEPSVFGFAGGLSLLDPENAQGRFALFAAETSRFERTYTRNNPLKYVDPDGRAVRLSQEQQQAFQTAGEIRDSVRSIIQFAASPLLTAGVDALLSSVLPRNGEEMIASLAMLGMPLEVPTGEFSIIRWAGYPEGVPKPAGPFQVLQGGEYQTARKAADSANRALHAADPSLAGKEIHEIQPIKFAGDPTANANKVILTPEQHRPVSTWWQQFLNRLKDFLSEPPPPK
jgi:hypothetical protein